MQLVRKFLFCQVRSLVRSCDKTAGDITSRCGLQVPSSESCQKPYLLPALMKEPCRFIRYTSLKSHGKFQIRLCSSNATRKILWCQDSAIGGCPSFSRQVNTLLCVSGNLQDCIGVVLEGLRTPLTFPVEVPWSSHTFLCRKRGRAKCIAASVSTLMLYLRGGPASAGPPSGPSGPSEHGKKADSEERARREHGWTEITLSHLQQLSFVKSSSPAGLQFDFKEVKTARLLGSLAMQPSNARCQLSSRNRASPYSLPGHERQKKKSISSSLAIKAPFKIQENILGQYVQLLLPKLLKLLGGVGTSWTWCLICLD